MRRAQTLLIVGAGATLLAAGARKSYENVNREIVIDAYYKDAQPANNILKGARTHERELSSRFEGRSFTRFAPAEFAKAVSATDMRVVNLIKEHATVERDGQTLDIDLDMLRRYVVSFKSNPDATDLLLFKAGYLLFTIAHEDGYADLMLPIDPAIVDGLEEAIKAVR